jgi:small subunit ribosomal protein S1
MNKFIDKLIELLQSTGLSITLILLLVFVLIVAATKPDNFKIYFGAIWQVLAGPFKFLRKKAIRFQIEGPLTKSLKKISQELPEIDIPELKINWVKTDDLETKLKEGKAIIKLKFENDNSRNIIKATSIYVKDAFLSNSKPYLSPNFTKAIDLTVTKKILLNANLKNKGNIIPLFINENKNVSSEVFEKCEKFEEIDDNGLFTRVILRELNGLGERLFGRTPKQQHHIESEEFLNFVHNVVIREYDDNTPLVYNNNIFKVGFLLVAKAETYNTYGLEAYYRRIRLSLAKGVKTFYLLARTDKVEILEKVATELIQTGNFILRNNPKEYIDNLNRKCICYSLEVNDDSILATTLENIGNAIKNKEIVNGVITSVRENRILIDINGISGEVKYHNLSAGEILDARHYFKEGSDIELKPLEILEGGNINFSLKNTKSDPLNFIKSKFEIGKTILCKVIYVDDNFIKLDVGNEVIEGIAFRSDLTFSKYIFLHKKFEIDNKYDFIIKDYDFTKGRLILELKDLKNPWNLKKFRLNQQVDFQIMRKTKNSFIGEVEEGVEALIPKYELSWTEKEQDNLFKTTTLSSSISCFVRKVEDDLLILSAKKNLKNPYIKYFEENINKSVKFTITSINEYGINGKINELSIYIPKYELSWNGEKYNYRVNQTYDVSIKELGKNKDKLIGSFKPILTHPLEDFSKKFQIGKVLKDLKIKEVFDWGIIYKISFKRKEYDGLLLTKNISNNCFISDMKSISKHLNNIPLCISEINLEQNRIILSLSNLTKNNIGRIEQLDYENEYNAIIIGNKYKVYSVILPNIWIEGKLETENNYNAGDTIKIRPSRIMNNDVIFTDE